jgi:hypothetical protein
MTTPAREFLGHVQAGGEASGAPWAEATFLTVGDEVAILVNQTEVARLTSPTVTDTGANDVFLIEGGDEPLFFRPRDADAFRSAVLLPQTTAERIAAASAAAAAAQDATMVMDTVPEPEPTPIAEEEAEPPWWRQWWWLVAIAALVLVLLVAFCGGDGAGTSTTTSTTLAGSTTTTPGTSSTSLSATTTTAPAATTTTNTAVTTTTTAPATTTTASSTTSTSLPDPVFGAGTHMVGDDVQPGIYETGIIQGPFGCYWERLSGLSGEIDDIIANGNVAGHDVVEIIDGDVAFGTDCDAWYDLTQREPLLTAIPEGKWVLGTHVAPGTYEAPGGDNCYWERLSGLSGTPEEVIANDLPQGPAIVEIDPGDVAFNSIQCGEWVLAT